MDDHLLRRGEVETRTGLARTTIYRLMRAGQFPEPVQIGPRAVRWPASEIATWVANRPRSHGAGIDRGASKRSAGV